MRRPTYQFFSLEEYQERLDALRSRMEQRGVDVLLVTTPENLYYLSGYQTPGYYWYQTLIVLPDREPVLITRLNESSNIEPLSWVEDSRPYGDAEDWIAKTKETLEDLGVAGKRIGIEKKSWFITIDDLERLTAAMPSATIVDGSNLVEEGRVVKSPQEVIYIRQAARAVEAGILAGIEASEVGATENDVAAEIHRAQIRAGSEYTGLPIFVHSGPRARLCHATWYRRRLEPNEIVHLEIPGCVHRYHAAKWAQVYLGNPPGYMLEAFEHVIEINKLIRDTMRPGVSAGDIWEQVRKTVEDAGLGSERGQRMAYSIGIAFAPDWGEGYILSVTEGEQRELQAGMVFHVTGAHGLTLPEGGSAQVHRHHPGDRRRLRGSHRWVGAQALREKLGAPVGGEMKQTVAALGAPRDALAHDQAVRLEVFDHRLAPGGLGEVDCAGGVVRIHLVAELDQRLVHTVLGCVHEVHVVPDLEEAGGAGRFNAGGECLECAKPVEQTGESLLAEPQGFGSDRPRAPELRADAQDALALGSAAALDVPRSNDVGEGGRVELGELPGKRGERSVRIESELD